MITTLQGCTMYSSIVCCPLPMWLFDNRQFNPYVPFQDLQTVAGSNCYLYIYTGISLFCYSIYPSKAYI